MRHRLFVLTALLCSVLVVLAQSEAAGFENSIDHFVNSKSTLGQSKFTSVVERDPKTREVIRVVKMRELTHGIDISACRDCFEDERGTGRFTHRVEFGERHTLLLTVERKQQSRIYMLQYTGERTMHARDGKVTIVIKRSPPPDMDTEN